MKPWQRLFGMASLLLALAICAPAARAAGDGQDDLDEALRVKITAEGDLKALNQVIEKLESALEKGLDVENSDFAEQVLTESLFERSIQLVEALDGVPSSSLADRRIQQVRAMATSDLRRVLMYDNPPPQASALLAKLLSLPGGDAREARGLLDKMIAAETFAALPVAEQAEAYALRARLQRGPERALADFARAIELDPDNVDHRLDKAQFQFANDQVDEALAEVAAIVEKTPDQVAAHLLQAQIFRALKKYDEAIETLEKVQKLAPGSIVPFEIRGEIYREQGEYEKSIVEFSRILQMQPGLDEALIRRAEAYIFAEKLDQALADVEAVLKNNPALAIAHGLRGQILAAQGRFADAIAEMKLLADDMPGQADVRMQLALYYQLNDQAREAIDVYSEVIELDDENFMALRGRGDAYLGLGDHAAAIEDFAAAYEVNGEDSSLLNNYAWVLATSPDDNVRNGARAIELATKACELTDYDAAHILSTLAAAYAESGDFATARKWSQEAVDKEDEENDPQLRAELASYKEEKPWRERQAEGADAGDDDDNSDDAAANEDGDSGNESRDESRDGAEESADREDADDEDAEGDSDRDESPAKARDSADQDSADRDGEDQPAP
jgi:tetratricopeptide (TPR) repeat protein